MREGGEVMAGVENTVDFLEKERPCIRLSRERQTDRV